MTQLGTIQPVHGPFQNCVVSIFFHTSIMYGFCPLSFIIVTTVVQAMQRGRFINEVTDALSHPLSSVTSHTVLRAFAEVSMISIS
jgi:hypothetical protein